MAASCFVSSAVSTNSSSSSVGGLACLPSRKSPFPNPVSPSPCGFAGSSGTGWAPAPGGASHDGTPHERAFSSCRKTSNPSSSSVRLRETRIGHTKIERESVRAPQVPRGNRRWGSAKDVAGWDKERAENNLCASAMARKRRGGAATRGLRK